jgi:hypothetical protein
MAGDAGKTPTPQRFEPSLSDIKARPMGDLMRGEQQRWDVLLETYKDEGIVRGRIHFVSGSSHRLSGWIFVERSEKDVEERFGEFSAQELWNLLDSLA